MGREYAISSQRGGVTNIHAVALAWQPRQHVENEDSEEEQGEDNDDEDACGRLGFDSFDFCLE